MTITETTAEPASAVRVRHRGAVPVGLILAAAFLVAVTVAAVFPSLLSKTDPLYADPLVAFESPSASHWFGTDQLGRDVYSRVVHGAGHSLVIGLSAIVLAVVFGALIGVVAGLSRGLVDEVLSRFLDVVSAFPDLLLALLLISFTGPGTLNLIFALGVASVPRFARVVRAQTFVIVEAGYVEQAKTFGLSRATLIRRHILPHAVASLPILATLGLGTTILGAAALSFLGMGPQPPSPEWGAMLSEGRNYLRQAWWVTVLPGVAVTLTVVSVTVLGRHWQARFEGRTVQ